MGFICTAGVVPVLLMMQEKEVKKKKEKIKVQKVKKTPYEAIFLKKNETDQE